MKLVGHGTQAHGNNLLVAFPYYPAINQVIRKHTTLGEKSMILFQSIDGFFQRTRGYR